MENTQNGMTKLMYQYATSGTLSFEEAKALLHETAFIRTANETFARYCRLDVMDTQGLKERVSQLLLESDPSQRKDSVERKVGNWVRNQVQYISRESALQMAFALQLPPAEAENLLWRLCGRGFHWRDPQDIVWLYALDHGLNYMEATALLKRMTEEQKPEKTVADDQETMTRDIRDKVQLIQTESELKAYLTEAAQHLGTLHNTAYDFFMGFMDLLKKPHVDDSLPEDRTMTSNEILITYLYNNLIPRLKKDNGAQKQGKGKSKKNTEEAEQVVMDAIQRSIQLNWPDEYVLARMINRETDVTRKMLILLFLACDGGETEYANYSCETRDDVFQDTKRRLEKMLNVCGFSPLDPRVPFDWMVLYCMVAEDVVDIDDHMISFLTEIFRRPDEEPEA